MLTILKTDRYEEWIDGLHDAMARLRITKHFLRCEANSRMLGDVKPVGDGVSEVRFFFGPGYRVYFTRRGSTVVLLLVGGDKSTQTRDIGRAREMAEEWRKDA